MDIIQSKISQEKSKIMNFCKSSYQPILRYLYTETIKRGGEISLHKHFIDLYRSCKEVSFDVWDFSAFWCM